MSRPLFPALANRHAFRHANGLWIVLHDALRDRDSAGYSLLLYRNAMGAEDHLAYSDALLLLKRGADPNRCAADGVTVGKMLNDHRRHFQPTHTSRSRRNSSRFGTGLSNMGWSSGSVNCQDKQKVELRPLIPNTGDEREST